MRIIKPSKRPGKGRINSQADFLDNASSNTTSSPRPYAEAVDRISGSNNGFTKQNDLNSPGAGDLVRDDKANSVEVKKKEFDQVFNRGVKLLSMREHSVKELTDKLRKKNSSATLVYEVIDKLLAHNYLSNERFTESYVRSRSGKGVGPIKIQAELSNKGVDNGTIQDYLKTSSAIWFEIAAEQHHKKYGDKPVSDYNEWTKRARFLRSRGFSMEHIQVTLPNVDLD